MCSIIGFCGSGVTFDLFKEGFDKTKSRGPDDSRIIDTLFATVKFTALKK